MKLTSRIIVATTLTCTILGMGAIFVHINSLIAVLNRQNNERGASIAYALVAKLEEQPKKSWNKIISEYSNGYLYPQINVFDQQDEILVANQITKFKRNSPLWFLKIFVNSKISPVVISSSYWKSISHVEVVFNQEASSGIIWHSSQIFIYYYLGFLVIVLCVQYMVMNNFREIVRAASMVNQRNFSVDKMSTSAPDLLELINLINYLPHKIQQVLQGQVSLNNMLKTRVVLNDSSNLHNKWFFESQLQHLLHSSKSAHGGYLLYFSINNSKINHQQISRLFAALSKKFKMALSAHFDDDVFALVILGSNVTLLEQLLLDVQNDLCAKNIGVVRFSQDSYKDEICARAYAALKQAESSIKGLHINEQDMTIAEVVSNWQEFISKKIAQKSLLLSYHPVYLYGPDTACLHYEVVMQMSAPENIILGGSNFLPHVENLKLTFELLKLQIESVLEHVADNFHAQHNYAIKLEESVVVGGELLIKYFLGLLSSYNFPSLLRKITFEISEDTVRSHYSHVLNIAKFLKRNKINLGVYHFGVHVDHFEELHDLNISYLKIDGCYTKNIEKNYDHQIMVKSFVELAHGFEVLAIATHVETSYERDKLLELKVDGMQGLFMGLGIR